MIAKKAPNPIDKHVGSRVRMRRMMLSMSQEKLGDALGLTFQQVQKYEKGTNRIGASRLQQISNILQVPVAFFFEGAPHVQSGTRHEGMWVRRLRPPMSPIFSPPRTAWRSPRRSRASMTPSCGGASSTWSSKSPTTSTETGFGARGARSFRKAGVHHRIKSGDRLFPHHGLTRGTSPTAAHSQPTS